MSVEMTHTERERFLAGVHIGVLGIPETGRGPLTVPLWYRYEPGGELQFTTARDSRKGRRLLPGVRISLCAQDETPPYKYVSIEGPVIAVEASVFDRDERQLAHRYLGTETGERYLAATGMREAAAGDVLVRVRPERWSSADYSTVLAL